MEILELVNIRFEIVLAIVGVVEVIKDIIERRQVSIYVIMTLLFSIGISYGISIGGIREIATNAIIYFGVTTLLYKTIVRTLEKKVEQYSGKKKEV